MRIACLQFAPQVGDVDNNLNRADAVLSKANPDDLDVLILPELAFTGYNFKSLQDISPFLEPSGSGISSLWARTTALKYNCVVGVGYPEKVDVAQKWPTSPEYYNSLIVVNGEGETVANYRKSFLYYTDETWALEGPDGFFEGYIPGLGHCSMGICMDLNPYKFEAPWHAFEFAFHILEMESNLVIVSMAWLTREEGRLFSRMPKEPDMDTLTYWVTRLEPLIRAENEEEIIVVFCNRTGVEEDAVYAGTSAVIGIKEGEVSVYGILGRGEKELLVVDTDNAPVAKLIYRPDGDSAVSSLIGERFTGEKAEPPPPPPPFTSMKIESPESKVSSSPKHSPIKPESKESPKITPIITSPADTTKSSMRKGRPQSPKIQIPYSPSLAEVAAKLQHDAANRPTTAVSPEVPTPTGPSPTPQSVRPQFGDPEPLGRNAQKASTYVLTPHPNAKKSNDTRIFGGHVLINQEVFTPTTPFEDPTPASPRYFWMPDDSLLKSPKERDDWTTAPPKSPILDFKSSIHAYATSYTVAGHNMIPKADSPTPAQDTRSGFHNMIPRSIDEQILNQPDSARDDEKPLRPSSPKSRNASRTGRLERSDSSLAQRPDITTLNQRLEMISFRPGPVAEKCENTLDDDDHQPDRPTSPKSRNASRSRPWLPADDLIAEQRQGNLSRGSVLIGVGPSALDRGDIQQSSNVLYGNPESPFRPLSRSVQHRIGNAISGTTSERPVSRNEITRQGTPLESGADRPQSRNTFSIRGSNIPESINDEVSSRTASRGRQPGFDGPIIDGKRVTLPERSQSRRATNRPEQSLPRGRSREQRSNSNEDFSGTEIIRVSPGRQVHSTQNHDSSHPILTPHDIVGMEIVRPSPSCPVHGHRRPSTSRQVSSRHSMINPHSQAQSSPPLAVKVPREATHDTQNSVPTLRGSSVETIVTTIDSPSTPPHEPRTPKAMVLIADDDMTTNTALSSPISKTKTLKCLDSDITGNGIDRPKSAVW